MAADKAKQFWTAIVSFFCGVLAALRPTAPAAPAALEVPAVATGSAASAASTADRRDAVRAGAGADVRLGAGGSVAGTAYAARTATRVGAVALPGQRSVASSVTTGGGRGSGWGRRVPRERALPPTIKQRIHAEAHGASPAVRRLTTAGVLAADHRPAEHAADDEDADGGVPVGAASAR
ncbi:hypothetical protein SUDANB37_02795 [Streptomyces sp. enrichment culture]